jgi:catalase
MFWDFMTSCPETTHQLLRVFSDVGIPDGYRHMHAFGVNAYKMVNATGKAVYVKFHYLVSSTSILSLKKLLYIFVLTIIRN